MAGKSRQKSAANVVENVTLSLNERILKDCHALYTDSENGENLQSKPRQIIVYSLREIVGRSYNIPGQNLLQAKFGIAGKVILCRIIIQVAPLIPAWGKKLRTEIR